MEIRKYEKKDEKFLFDLLISDGDDWADYHGPIGRSKYVKAIESSLTYIAIDQNIVCGYVRCRDDDGFGIYIYDLLARKSYRGNNLGKSLMERVLKDFPNQTVYVMSDVDAYYEKIGYLKEGSIFIVKANEL